MTPKQPVMVIDWSEVVFDLERAGLTQREIAARCGYDSRSADGAGKAWVNKLKNRVHAETKFHEGALLLGLWAELTGRTPAEAPRSDLRARNDSKLVTAERMDEAVTSAAGRVYGND